MRTLTIEETSATSGAIAPAIYGAFMAYNYIRIAYTSAQIVEAATAVAVTVATVGAFTD